MIEALTARPGQKAYVSSLRAASINGQRPTAMILHDPYALHRKWWDSNWEPRLGDDVWVQWDYILADVFQIIDDYTDKSSGQIMWFDQSGDVWWEVKSMFSGSNAAVEKEEASRGKLREGEKLYAVPIFGENVPTMESWIVDMVEEKADLRPKEFKDSRPPTAEERAKLKELKQT